jgi:large subunit ribosomal protein L2
MNYYLTRKKSIRKIIKVNEFTSKKPLIKKNLNGLVKKTAGRNNLGRITIRHRGGGNKKKYRKITFYRSKLCTGIVFSIEYDPNRTANIAAVYDYFHNDFFYFIATKNLKIGDIVKSSSSTDLKLGHSLSIEKIPVGSFIHSLK